MAFIYKNVVANSVAYMMMSRLGIDTDGYFELDDFRDVTNFNTQETLNALGFATSDIAEMGLTEVSKTITALNRQNRIIVGQDRNEYNKVENNDERSLDNERTDLHDGGRLQPSEPETSTAAGSDVGQIRSDEERVSEGTSQSPLLQSPDEGRTDTSLGGSGTESQQDGGNNPEPDGTERGSDRTDESGGYDEMGSSDELPSQLGTGNRESGSDIRLEDIKPLPDMGGQLSFIQERAEEQTASAFSIPKEIIDNYLASGSGFANGKYRIYEQLQKSLSLKENADFLKKEYGTGGGTYAGGVSDYNYDCDAKGVRIRKGYEENAPEIRMNWTEVAKEIGRLISDDRYLNKKEWWNYPEWLAEQEVKRTRVAEQVKNREVMSTVPAEKEPEEQEMPQDVEYEYHLGDKVYIGASEYEILSIDDERVMLYDYDMPLFNKEFSHIEFDEKVRENPMNEHLIVKEVPTEERNVTVDYNDAFFINQDNATVTWIYYNPDSAAGGQYVTNILNFDEITEIAKDSQTSNEFFDRLGSIANQTLADVGTEWFSEAESRFLEKPDFTDCTQDTMQSLISEAEKSSVTEVQTNMGSMPIEDYREIVASQSGFDSYDEMYKQGYRIGNGYDI